MRNGHPVPVTKDELNAALTALKNDLQAALSAQTTDLQAAIIAHKDDLRNALTESMRQIETNLLTEFHRYAKGQQVRTHHLETTDSDLILRLATIEERLLALESRRPPSV